MTPRSGPVLHFIDTTGPGGAETVFLQLADGLRERGWPARTLVVGPGWVLDQVRRLNLPVDVVPTRGRIDVRFIRALNRLIRRHDVRLIHAHLLSAAVYASIVGRWTSTPVVATYHGASDTEAAKRSRNVRHWLVDRSASLVCVSAALRENLGRIQGVRAERAQVIHNGVATDAYAAADGSAVRREHGIAQDAFLVGALGNMRPAKDFPNFIRAAVALSGDRRFVFAIAGERTEPLHGELTRLRDQLGLKERLTFWGFRSDVPEVLSALDVLAISSSSEGFSLAAIQAMAAGTPVVSTRSGGPEGILTDELDGLLVAPGSPDALAGAILRVSTDTRLRQRLVEQARRTVRERFSLASMLDSYEQLYARIAPNAHPIRGQHVG